MLPESSRHLTVGASFGKVQPLVPINKMAQTLQDIIKKTKIPLQWEALNSNYIVYPVGKAGWNDNVTDAEGEEVERDGYKDAYAAKTPKDVEDED